MAISWGGYESSGGNGIRVGIDVDTSNVSHGDRTCSFAVSYYTQNIHTWSDSQSLNLGGSIGGSIGYQNNQGEGVTHRGTRSYIYDYGNSEYGATGKSRTFSATVNGAYNGVTPSKSVTVGIPGRPIAAPVAPSGASLDRINDEANLVTWNNRETPGEPYDTIIVQRSVNGGSFSTVANLGGGSTKYSDSGAIPNRYWQYKLFSKNSAGTSAGADATNTIWTSPATPTACARTVVGDDQKVTWNNNTSYPQYVTEVWVSVDGAAYTHLVSVADGVTSYTHASATLINKYQYKVRARCTGTPTLYSSFSGVTSQSGGTTTPPDPPSNLAPAGDLVKDPTQPIVLTWQHNPTDGSKQTNWQIQYRVDGGSWTTVNPDQPSQADQSMYTLEPGIFSYSQEIEWQVATTGADPAFSAWSEIAGFDTQSLTPIKYPIYLDLASGRMEALSTGAPSAGGSAVPAHMHVTRTAGAHSLQSGVFEALALDTVISESGLAISFTPGGSTPPGGYFTIHETGVYDCSAQFTVAPNVAGRRILDLRINGSLHTQMETPPAPGAAAGTVGPTLGTTAHLNEGDQVWFEMWQNSGATLAVTVRNDIYWGRITKVDAGPGPQGPQGPPGESVAGAGPMGTWVAVIDTPVDLPTTSTALCQVTVPVTNQYEKFLVIGTGDFQWLTSSGTAVGILSVDGVEQTGRIVAQSGAGVGWRVTGHQSWIITGLPAGSRVFQLRGLSTVNQGWRANPIHSGLTITRLTGATGPPGPAGGTYTHTQGVAAASWVIDHPLTYRPNVTVVDSSGRQVEGDVVYTDADTVTVGFSGAFAGTAYLS